MKKRILLLLLLVSGIGLINSEVFGTVAKYDRTRAVEYAESKCSTTTYNNEKYKCFNPKNPNCENYNKGGGTDCANFVSQALIDGKITFSDCLVGKGKSAMAGELVAGADVTGKDGNSKGIILANDLITALQNSYCFKKVSASEAKEGDIAAWRIKGRNWVHHVAILNEEGYYAGHTSDVCFDAKKKAGDYVDKN